MTSSRARHRAPAAPLHWVSLDLIATAAVPVGALAGCVVAAVSSSSGQPGIGLAGLVVAGLPLGLHGWRSRRATRGRARHGVDRWEGLEQLTGTTLATGAGEVPLVIDLTGADEPSRTSPVALPAPAAALLDDRRRQVEIAQLRRMWATGTGPHTGPVARPLTVEARLTAEGRSVAQEPTGEQSAVPAAA